jgi:hypothetical protein
MVTRRGLLKTLLAIPFVGALVPTRAAKAEPVVATDEEWAFHGFDAIPKDEHELFQYHPKDERIWHVVEYTVHEDGGLVHDFTLQTPREHAYRGTACALYHDFSLKHKQVVTCEPAKPQRAATFQELQFSLDHTQGEMVEKLSRAYLTRERLFDSDLPEAVQQVILMQRQGARYENR